MKDLKLMEPSGYWENVSTIQTEPAAYASRIKRILDAEAIMREAENCMIEAEKEGRMSGLYEGIMLGVKVGKLEANKENARKMLSMNLAIENIIEITQLSAEEIKKLEVQHSR